ncbi:MAG: 3-deoxy-D-manno-octulosonic acid transferase [Halomonadaceae bacterium]|nr:MAG: 3-deoxy-D-manno-octulosonic acid transferase [Halomonadaceae bacterium]
MGRLIYSLLLYIALPFILLMLAWRALGDRTYARRWQERLGHVPAMVQPGVIWIHAVSVGETLAALPLIRQLQQRHPDRRLLVTTMTPTGSERVKASLGDSVSHVYLPYDLPHMVARFLRRVRPSLLVVMETEVWPNIVSQCHQQQIPVILANARLSEGSARGYRKVAFLARPVFQRLQWIAAQSEADAARFLSLGVAPERVTVTGSIKYDVAVGAEAREAAAALRRSLGKRPVWIAASTHEGEEEAVLAAHKALREQHGSALLILVPRHPERFDPAARRVKAAGLSLVRRSQGLAADRCAVYLGDTMGELLMLFGAADVAFVGGSLIRRGGHNPLEPAAWALPVIVGPHVFNFASVCDGLSDKGGLMTVAENGGELQAQLIALMNDPQQRAAMGQAARQVIAANRGALERLQAGLEPVLAATAHKTVVAPLS